jgi:hypothetical protein
MVRQLPYLSRRLKAQGAARAELQTQSGESLDLLQSAVESMGNDAPVAARSRM